MKNLNKMKERPILFSSPMVRAILEGRKTITRRVIKPQPFSALKAVATYQGTNVHGQHLFYPAGECDDACEQAYDKDDGLRKCPYEVGMSLWVRETFSEDLCWKHSPDEKDRIIYKADNFEHAFDIKWKPSIFMPRWASRITLEITNVKIEMLQDITEEDAIKEGCLGHPDKIIESIKILPRGEFHELWDSINGKGAWDKNPYVWVIEFKTISHPVDEETTK